MTDEEKTALKEVMKAALKENRAEAKEVQKEAIKEWIDEKFAQFGKYSLGAAAAATIGALTYFILTMNGWHR